MGSLGAMALRLILQRPLSQEPDKKLVPEGVEGRVPYRGRWLIRSNKLKWPALQHGLLRHADHRAPGAGGQLILHH